MAGSPPTVIVTGGSLGIGKGIAKSFSLKGSNVVIVARNKQNLEVAVQEITKLKQEKGVTSGLISYQLCDVSQKEQVVNVINEVYRQYGRIDILCANAGYIPQTKIADMSENEFDEVMAINVKGSFLPVQAVLPIMKAQHYGRIVLTSSITGPITGYTGWSHYGASKAAQLGFMRSVSLEVAKEGITINAVLPGNILTEGLIKLGPDYIKNMEKSIPVGHLGEVEDIGNAVLFLASPEAKFITGQTLVVDGGQTLPEEPNAFQ